MKSIVIITQTLCDSNSIDFLFIDIPLIPRVGVFDVWVGLKGLLE